ncbi:MAG: acyltransferase [Flavobacteriia bacterium]|nr:acyltransferase [Flavobacteriia bacterium]
MNTQRINELDALRGVAAILVVLFHCSMGRVEAKYGFVYGKTGVDLFFLISGFVIYKSIRENETLKSFMIKRFCRLYPTYWAGVFITYFFILSYSYLGNHPSMYIKFSDFLINLSMFQNYFKVANLDGPYWTLSVEMNFYIIIGLLLFFRKLKYFILIGIGLCVYNAIVLAYSIDNYMVNQISFFLPILMYTPLFIAGMAFYRIFENKSSNWTNYGIVITCFLFKMFFLKIDYIGENSFISFEEHIITQFIYFMLFIAFVNNYLGFIANKVTLFLGRISYSMYLIHQFLVFYIILPFAIEKLKINFYIATFCFALPVVILIATFITYRIEIPLNNKIRTYLLKNQL